MGWKYENSPLIVAFKILCALLARLLQSIRLSNQLLVKYVWKYYRQGKQRRWGFHMSILGDDKQKDKVIHFKWYIEHMWERVREEKKNEKRERKD